MSTDPNIVEFHKGLKRLRQKQQKACEKRRYARFTIVDKVLTGEELFQSRLDAEVEYSDASAITRVKESTVDHGYYVFAVMRGGVAVFIGTCDGSGRQRMGLFEAQQKYQGGSAIILQDGLSKQQALNIRKTLIRRLKPCENGRKVEE